MTAGGRHKVLRTLITSYKLGVVPRPATTFLLGNFNAPLVLAISMGVFQTLGVGLNPTWRTTFKKENNVNEHSIS